MLTKPLRETPATALARMPVSETSVVPRDRIGDDSTCRTEPLKRVDRTSGRMVDPLEGASDRVIRRRRTQIRLEGRPVLAKVVPRPSEARPIF